MKRNNERSLHSNERSSRSKERSNRCVACDALLDNDSNDNMCDDCLGMITKLPPATEYRGSTKSIKVRSSYDEMSIDDYLEQLAQGSLYNESMYLGDLCKSDI